MSGRELIVSADALAAATPEARLTAARDAERRRVPLRRRLKERGLGILITDHNVRETLKLVDRAYLIHKGEVAYEGAAEQLVNDPKAREIYLGPEFNL